MFFPVAGVLDRFSGFFSALSSAMCSAKRFACRLKRLIPALLAAVLGITPHARGETIELLKDINPFPSTVGSTPSEMVQVGSMIYFAAITPEHGRELWKSDGTVEGTVMVKDIWPGTGSGNPFELVNVNGTLYFRASDGTTGFELWKSDGTAEGTMLVKDINETGESTPIDLLNVEGTLYFIAYSSGYGYRLWKSDGTPEGTVVVRHNSFSTSTGLGISNLARVGHTVFFKADRSGFGVELWKTNGTEAGTIMVKDISPGSSGSDPSNFVEVNGVLFFTANTSQDGTELWKSDGTAAGTVLVRDINPGDGSSNPASLVNVGGVLYFSATNGAGMELWKSDGTAKGTVMVRDIFPGLSGATVSNLVNVNGTLFFAANDGISGIELWKSNGTSEGTVLVRDINAGKASSQPSNLVAAGNLVFFKAYHPDSGIEVWRSDGTEAGTFLLRDIEAGTSTSYAADFANIGGTVFFRARDAFAGDELWKSDGTPAGTVLVKDISTGGSSSSPTALTDVEGTLFFGANDGVSGVELWKSDGSPEGTVQVKDINPGKGSSIPNIRGKSNGTLFFEANHSNQGTELWKSDGTEEGTVMLKYMEGEAGSASIGEMVDVGGTLFFKASNQSSGDELWKTDGTAEGTMMVKEIIPGPSRSAFVDLINHQGILFFWHAPSSSVSSLFNYALWRSDGTAEGTTMVKDFSVSYETVGPLSLLSLNGTLFLRGKDDDHGAELWRSDGTPEGTVLLKDINPGRSSSYPANFVNVNGILFFTASDDVAGHELWKSDGTAEGTVMVKDIRPGINSSSPRYLVNVDGVLFFIAYDTAGGLDLWKSDGTPDGTLKVKDIRAGKGNAGISGLVNINGTLFFQANDGVSGNELWKSDGTAEGTVRVMDLVPGMGGSNPSPVVASGGRLFLSAITPEHGRELLVVLPTTPSVENQTVGSVRPGSAVIQTVISANGAVANVWVEYGTTPNLGSSITSPSVVSPSSQTLSFTLPGLQPRTTYYYRIVAENSAGTAVGEIRSFTASDVHVLVAESGDPAPRTGQGAGLPEGTILRSFGTPALSDARRVAAKVALAGGSRLNGIHIAEDDGFGSLPAVQNGAALGVSGGRFVSFLDPLLAPGGALGFGAKVRGPGITAANDEGFWTDALGTSGLELVLREGSGLPEIAPGARLKAAPSVSLRDSEMLALITLTKGKGGVTPQNDTALLRVSSTGREVLVREGEPLVIGNAPASKVVQISTLSPAPGSPGHGRWHADGGKGVARLKLANKQEVVVRWNAEGDLVPVLATGSEVAELGSGAKWQKLGLPAISTDGSGVALSAQLQIGAGGVTQANDAVLVYQTEDGTPEQAAALHIVAQEGMSAPGVEGARFTSFSDPVVGGAGELAFMAGLKRGGTKAASHSSLWWRTAQGELELVAQQGGTATDQAGAAVNGRLWNSIVSYALPSGTGAGPIFVARVSGPGINASNNLGLWAVDSQGVIRELVRTGAEVELESGAEATVKTLRSFSVLSSARGSFGASRSFNATGSIAVQATFNDHSQALIRLDIP